MLGKIDGSIRERKKETIKEERNGYLLINILRKFRSRVFVSREKLEEQFATIISFLSTHILRIAFALERAAALIFSKQGLFNFPLARLTSCFVEEILEAGREGGGA